MKLPVTVKVLLLTIGATLFYTWVGQLVPQKEVHPPEVVELQADMTPEEMAALGKEIYEGKGLCQTCHGVGARFPDLEGIATRAGTRIPEMDALAYLSQSLYDPNAYIVPGYSAGMPEIAKPPIDLTDEEILMVVAYLQTLGGQPTVTPETELPFKGS